MRYAKIGQFLHARSDACIENFFGKRDLYLPSTQDILVYERYRKIPIDLFTSSTCPDFNREINRDG
jgi:hypothetical protein